MITVFPSDASDFSTLGIAVLQPYACTVEENAGGLFELEMTAPIDDDLKWACLACGNIVKAPCAVREAPVLVVVDNVPAETTETKTRAIYRVKTYTGKRLRLRSKPSNTGRILGYYNVGTEVVRISASNGWARVVVCKNGAAGYMSDERLQFVRNETETVTSTVEKVETIVKTEQTREQLFRIYSVRKDTEKKTVTVNAQHIFYDLAGVIVASDYAPENTPADTVIANIVSRLSQTTEFAIHCNVATPITGDYTGVSLVKALLDPDIGIIPQTGARIIRDNFDVYIVPDMESNRGVEIRHKKNLIGATLQLDASNVVTRIMPIGRTANDGRLKILENDGWVSSPNIALYPYPRDMEVEYDVSVGRSDGQYATETLARAKLKELAEADFANGADAQEVSLDVSFTLLQNTMQYKDYENLLHVFLYDTVRVIASFAGINVNIRVNGYTYNCLTKQYDDVKLGAITDVTQTIYGYDISDASLSGTKLIPATVPGSALKNATVQYAKITLAAIDQLAADAITATTARIVQIVADQATTDELYAAIADIITLTVQQITAATVSTDQLYAALAQVIELRVQQITAATISTDQLYAALADVIVLRAQQAALASVEADNLTAAIATISDARIDSADIGFAQIKDLVTGTAIIAQGVGGKYYIANLAVTEANIVSLSVGELMVKGTDGRLYRLGVDEAGQITNTPIQIEGADVAGSTLTGGNMIENTITTRELNVQNIFADNAMIRELIAANLDVGTLFAREATIAALNAADISGNASLNLYVKQADLSTYLRLTTGQVELGETDSEVKVQLRTGENAGLYIVEGTQANAYFGQNKARIERLEMGDAILIGNTAIVAQNNGDDVYWLGR